MVTDASGAPRTDATVIIACDKSRVSTSTDASGRYLTNISFSGPRPTTGRMRCSFSEPDPTAPRAHLDTTLVFTHAPFMAAMAALQTVDLHESSGR
jgi:hypothetical protein